jgi:hypothetical protein
MSLWPKVREELNTMVNRHFDTPEYKHLFSVKLTPARQQIWDLHYPHYIKAGATAGARRAVMRRSMSNGPFGSMKRRTDLRQAHGLGAFNRRADGRGNRGK